MLPRSVHELNERQAQRVAQRAREALGGQGGRVGVLGLAFKPDTNVVEESQGLAIARLLADAGVEVMAFDPAAMETTRAVLGDRIRYAASGQECVESCRVVVIATPWPEFSHLDYSAGHPPSVIDAWRIAVKRPPGWGGVGFDLGSDDSEARLEDMVKEIVGNDPAP